MADRVVALSLQLKGVNTLGELEQTLKDVNKELKLTDSNSKAFTELSKVAVDADSKIKTLKADMKGMSDQQKEANQAKELEKVNALYIKQADSVAKVASAMGAGLSVATVAASHFGEETQESVQKAIRTASELTVVLQSIKPITEALNGENVKLFKGFVDGFKKSSAGAKVFGNTTKTAIAGTGIGLLITAIALLVANWETVTKAVKSFIDETPFLSSIGDVIDTISNKVGSLGNLFGALGSAVKALLQFKDPMEAFQNSLANGIVVENLENQISALDEVNAGIDRQIKLLEAQGGKEEEIFKLKKKRYEGEIDLLSELKSSSEDFSNEQQEQLDEATLNLELLSISQTQYYEKLAEERSADLLDARENELAKLELADEIAKEKIDFEEKVTQDLVDSINSRIKEIEDAEKNASDLSIINVEETEEEKAEVIELSVLRENAIRANASLVEKNRLNGLLDEQIKYYEDLGELTEEQEDVLLQLKLEKLSEFVDAAAEVISQVGDISESITDAIDTNIDNIDTQLDTIDDKYEASTTERESLEAQLATADGARRESILASIEEERQEELALEAERKKLNNEKIKQQNKQNNIQFANDIAQAIASGAQAVLSALNSVPPASFVFAALAGVMAGVNIATITANKPKPIPLEAATGGLFGGGFTGPGTTLDHTGHKKGPLLQLHDNEYAYIASKAQLQNPAVMQLLSALESTRPMAEGGLSNASIPSNVNVGVSDNPNAIIADAIGRMIFQVAVTDINEGQNRVNVASSRATF